MEAAEGAVREGAGEAGAQALAVLHAEIPAFIDAFENHLRGEEEHLQVCGWVCGLWASFTVIYSNLRSFTAQRRPPHGCG